MKPLACSPWWAACVGASLSLGAAAQNNQGACERAWSSYNEFKRQNVMDPSQYPLTTQGAAVRAACGADALPVPPGTDTPHRPIIRKHVNPSKPAEPAKPAKP